MKREESSMVSVIKTAIICITIVVIFWMILNNKPKK
nr:MAG TPA: hypothetical protein [Caudoviricetes sp.]